MILTTCKYFDLVGNRCSRVTDGKCNDLQDCEFKYIAELKAENERLKEEIKNNKSAYQVELGTYNMECGNLLEENKQLWLTLQEIKKIAEDAYENDSEYQATGVYNEIIQKITKAESEG